MLNMTISIRSEAEEGQKRRGSLRKIVSSINSPPILVIKMMQGFGETSEPRDDTLDLMEAYVFEFINNVIHRSLAKS
jgi:hypothetical protein